MRDVDAMLATCRDAAQIEKTYEMVSALLPFILPRSASLITSSSIAWKTPTSKLEKPLPLLGLLPCSSQLPQLPYDIPPFRARALAMPTRNPC